VEANCRVPSPSLRQTGEECGVERANYDWPSIDETSSFCQAKPENPSASFLHGIVYCAHMGFTIDLYHQGKGKINMMAAEDVASPRPRRPPVVCDQCRIRKLKCDRKFPCNRCLKSVDKRVCTYTKAPRPRNLPVSSTESPVLRQPVPIAPPDISLGSHPGREQNLNPEDPQSQRIVLDENKASELFPSWCYHGQGSWQSLLRRVIPPLSISLFLFSRHHLGR
jgi:hypothetical protein